MANQRTSENGKKTPLCFPFHSHGDNSNHINDHLNVKTYSCYNLRRRFHSLLCQLPTKNCHCSAKLSSRNPIATILYKKSVFAVMVLLWINADISEWFVVIFSVFFCMAWKPVTKTCVSRKRVGRDYIVKNQNKKKTLYFVRFFSAYQIIHLIIYIISYLYHKNFPTLCKNKNILSSGKQLSK